MIVTLPEWGRDWGIIHPLRVGFCNDCDTFPSGVGIRVSFTRGGKGFAMLELSIGPFLRGLWS